MCRCYFCHFVTSSLISTECKCHLCIFIPQLCCGNTQTVLFFLILITVSNGACAIILIMLSKLFWCTLWMGVFLIHLESFLFKYEARRVIKQIKVISKDCINIFYYDMMQNTAMHCNSLTCTHNWATKSLIGRIILDLEICLITWPGQTTMSRYEITWTLNVPRKRVIVDCVTNGTILFDLHIIQAYILIFGARMTVSHDHCTTLSPKNHQ